MIDLTVLRYEACTVCGCQMVRIRGQDPNEDSREVCPTCQADRLRQIENYFRDFLGLNKANQNSQGQQ